MKKYTNVLQGIGFTLLALVAYELKAETVSISEHQFSAGGAHTRILDDNGAECRGIDWRAIKLVRIS
jgi:hypothetical protein